MYAIWLLHKEQLHNSNTKQNKQTLGGLNVSNILYCPGPLVGKGPDQGGGGVKAGAR